MSKITIVKEIRDAAELFVNVGITESLKFYESLETKYKPVVDKYFNKNSFNNEEPQKGIQPNLMKNFLNLTGNSILNALSSCNENDEVDISEIIQSLLSNDHKFQEAVAKIVGIHVGRNVPANLYPPVAKELIANVGKDNKLVEEILSIIGKRFIKAEEKQYDGLKEEYNIENFEDHKIKIEIKNADKNTAKIKFYRQNEQEVVPHKHGQIITVKVTNDKKEEKFSEFTVIKTGHDEKGYYYECLIKQNLDGYVTNYLFNSENQLIKAYPSYIESNIESNKNLVLISGGSGESYSISIINNILDEKNIELPPLIHIIHSTRNEKSDTFELDTAIKQLIDKVPNVRVSYNKYYTKGNGDTNNDNIHYHNDRMNKESLNENLGNNHDNNYKICASSFFSADIQQILKEWGVADNNIHIEGFGSVPEISDLSLVGQDTSSSNYLSHLPE